ncbi:hypothetical protein SAMN03159463_02507 [Mesorhizobium sp. NFR06]|nr:hypothetical protein SAMN03159463_02507 [Mesorhizobium sp. NFR06]
MVATRSEVVSPTFLLYGAPLCPAGHLPHKGGDQQSRRWCPQSVSTTSHSSRIVALIVSPSSSVVSPSP